MRECQVWWASPTLTHPGLQDLLSDEERSRAAAYHQMIDRDRSVVSAALLRLVVAHWDYRDPATVIVDRTCPRCARPHGRPTVVDSALHVSLSHSGDRVVVAATEAAPVGVDVEKIQAELDVEALSRSTLAEGEEAPDPVAFLTYWCRKESILKATGDGLSVSLASVVVSAASEPARLLSFEWRPDLVDSAQLYDLHPGADHVAALAVLTADPLDVTEQDGASLLAE